MTDLPRVLLAAPSASHHSVWATVVAALIVLSGLAMLLRPRQLSGPSRWEYKGVERVEPSGLAVALTRVFGLGWTVLGAVLLVVSLRR